MQIETAFTAPVSAGSSDQEFPVRTGDNLSNFAMKDGTG